METKDLLNLYYDNYKEEIKIRDSINARVGLPAGILTLLVGALLFYVERLPPHKENAISIFFHCLVLIGAACIFIAALYVIRAHWGYEYKFIPSLTVVESYREQLINDYRLFPDEALDPAVEFPAFIIERITQAATINRELNARKAIRLFRGVTFTIAALVSFALSTVPFYLLEGFKKPDEPSSKTATQVEGPLPRDDNQDSPPQDSTSGYQKPVRPPLESIHEGELKPELKILETDINRQRGSRGSQE